MGIPARTFRFRWRPTVYPTIPFIAAFLYCLLDSRYSYALLLVLIVPVIAEFVVWATLSLQLKEEGLRVRSLFGTRAISWSDIRAVRLTHWLRALVIRAWPEGGQPHPSATNRHWLRRLWERLRERRLRIHPQFEDYAEIVETVRREVFARSPGADVSLPEMSPSSAFRRWMLDLCNTLAWLLPAITLAALLFAFHEWAHGLDEQLRAREKILRDAGIPINGYELQRYLVPNHDDNSAYAYLAAAQMLTGKTGETIDQIERAVRFEPHALTREQLEWSRLWISQNAIVEQILAMAALRPEARYSSTCEEGKGIDTSYLGQIRHLLRFLSIRQRVQLHAPDGDPTKDIERMFEIAYSLRNQPTAIGAAYRSSCHTVALRSLEWTWSRREFTDVELKRLASLVVREINTISMEQILIGERALALQSLETIFAENINGPEWLFGNPGDSRRGWLPPLNRVMLAKSQAYILDSFETLGLSLGKPVDEASAMLADSPLTIWDSLEIAGRMSLLFVDMIAHQHRATLARIHILKTALMVERFRLGANRLPVNLSEIKDRFGTAIPNDPFSGEALRYTSSTTGYVIYSVGANNRDDGGRSDFSDGKDDISMHVDRK